MYKVFVAFVTVQGHTLDLKVKDIDESMYYIQWTEHLREGGGHLDLPLSVHLSIHPFKKKGYSWKSGSIIMFSYGLFSSSLFTLLQILIRVNIHILYIFNVLLWMVFIVYMSLFMCIQNIHSINTIWHLF